LSEKSWISVSDVCRCDANVIALIIWRTEKAEGKGFLKHLEKYTFLIQWWKRKSANRRSKH
jgi:hypothetical protein